MSQYGPEFFRKYADLLNEHTVADSTQKKEITEAKALKNAPRTVEIMDMRPGADVDDFVIVKYDGPDQKSWDAFLTNLSSVMGWDEYGGGRRHFNVEETTEEPQITINNIPPSAITSPGRFFRSLCKKANRF